MPGTARQPNAAAAKAARAKCIETRCDMLFGLVFVLEDGSGER
jgi:hypothetical protein